MVAESGGRRLRIALFGLAVGILHVLPPQNVLGFRGNLRCSESGRRDEDFFYSRGATLRT
jgi:hypothetical protein